MLKKRGADWRPLFTACSEHNDVSLANQCLWRPPSVADGSLASAPLPRSHPARRRADRRADRRHRSDSRRDAQATQPPIAILAYTDTLPVRTLVYPLATYSPEYQAICWAQEHECPVEFFDLPSDVFLGLQDAEIERRGRLAKTNGLPNGTVEISRKPVRRRADALPAARRSPRGVSRTVRANRRSTSRSPIQAGERDYDTYWERHFEHNPADNSYRGATFELGRALRELEEDEPRWRAENLVREAFMRRRVDEAIASGHKPERDRRRRRRLSRPGADRRISGHDRRRNWPRCAQRSSKLTLMPYSYFRLSSQSGYGAGNQAPAYFELLWEALQRTAESTICRGCICRWSPGNLREAGTHRSTAEVIDGVRLAETLVGAEGRTGPHAGRLARRRRLRCSAKANCRPSKTRWRVSMLARRSASLPEGVSQTSIQSDFDRELRRLKLEKYRTTVQQELELDLRENRR